MSELHGAINVDELIELGLDPAKVVDFSSNCLPGLAHPRIQAAVHAASIENYPSPDAAPLRVRLSACHGVPIESVVTAAGAAQLIFAAVQASSREGETVLVVTPSFGEYADAARALSRRVEAVAVEVDASPDLAPVMEAVSRTRPAMVFLCQPNNPTGRLWPADALDALITQCRDLGTVPVIDHAYSTFVDPAKRFVAHDHAINLYSLTKDFALAGLRLGYALAPAAQARSLDAVMPPWSVSQPALAAGLAALDTEVIAATDDAIWRVRESSAVLWAALENDGAVVLPTDTHFALIECPGASEFRHRLLVQAGLQVRSAASFGLPNHVRVASKGRDDDTRLIQAWKIESEAADAAL